MPAVREKRSPTRHPPGPLATYPGDDSWTERPFTDGVVLVGDSAGYNNPIIGQGLSIAMRDARTVRDVLRDGDFSPAAFVAYADERMERMRRLRFAATFMSAAFADECADRPARRARFFEMQQNEPLTLGMLVGMMGGPRTVRPRRSTAGSSPPCRAPDRQSENLGHLWRASEPFPRFTLLNGT